MGQESLVGVPVLLLEAMLEVLEKPVLSVFIVWLLLVFFLSGRSLHRALCTCATKMFTLSVRVYTKSRKRFW